MAAQKLLGSKVTMRRISAAAASDLPCALRISYSTVRARVRPGASSSTSRVRRSASSVAPLLWASAACSSKGARCRLASRAPRLARFSSQHRVRVRPLPQAHLWPAPGDEPLFIPGEAHCLQYERVDIG